MKVLMTIIVGIMAVGLLAMFMAEEFLWNLKDADFRWSLAIFNFLVQMVVVGSITYGLVWFMWKAVGASLWIW